MFSKFKKMIQDVEDESPMHLTITIPYKDLKQLQNHLNMAALELDNCFLPQTDTEAMSSKVKRAADRIRRARGIAITRWNRGPGETA